MSEENVINSEIKIVFWNDDFSEQVYLTQTQTQSRVANPKNITTYITVTLNQTKKIWWPENHFVPKFVQLVNFVKVPRVNSRGDSMISNQIFLTWIFWKLHQRIPECGLYIRKIKIVSLVDFLWAKTAKNVENFHFWIDFAKLLNQSFSMFYM